VTKTEAGVKCIGNGGAGLDSAPHGEKREGAIQSGFKSRRNFQFLLQMGGLQPGA